MTGLALLSPGIAAILYGLAQVAAHSGFASAVVLGPVLGGLAAIAAFTVRAIRQRPAAGPGTGARSSPSSAWPCSGPAPSPGRRR